MTRMFEKPVTYEEIIDEIDDLVLAIEGGNKDRPDIVLAYVKDEVAYLREIIAKYVSQEKERKADGAIDFPTKG